MSHGTDATVECPRCGRAFDPSVSGGWCTDSECGAWRVAETASGGPLLVTDGGTTEDARAENGDEEQPDVAEVWPDGDDESDAGGEADGSDPEGDESEADGESSEAGDDERPDADASGDADDNGETIACPACETEIAAGDNFCRACGADVSGIDDSGELTNCPSCETDVEPDDRFCRECGEHLASHRPGADEASGAGGGPGGAGGSPAGRTAGNAVASGQPAGTDAGRAGTGQSGPVDAETVKHGGSTAEAASTSGQTAADEPEQTGPRLSLVARNREVSVGDGDVVGKEIRSIIMDTGGEEEDAVRVHREHVRFEHEDDGFYLVDLGQNATVVNGEELEQGDRVPVEPGDRIDLSGVARIGVRQG